MYEINLKIIIYFYINASRFVAELIIIQFQFIYRIDIFIIITKTNALLQKALRLYIIIFITTLKLIAITQKKIEKKMLKFLSYMIHLFSILFNENILFTNESFALSLYFT